ncbi:MAG: alpha/beta hydrolase-fold protein [Gemmatimonadales bacterium]
MTIRSALTVSRTTGCLLVAITSMLGAQTPAIPAHTTFTISSHDVGETRTINVYTPPGYQTAARNRYAVLYMPDGGVAEDFPHVVISVDSLIRLGRIAPMLVVGIENTQRRRDMTGPTTVGSDSAIAPRVGGSAAFRSFIRDELMPEVKRRYRTTDETAIVGESLAGLFIVETFLYEPTLFRRYIAISPSVWWNHDELVGTAEARLAIGGMERRRLYLTAANEEGISTGTAKIAGFIKTKPPAGLIWWYEPRPDLEHGTIYLGQGPTALAKALRP